MPEDIIETLVAFTPAAVNRDEMLFAAGKAAARTPRIWKIAVSALLLSQSLTLLGWLAWPRAGTVEVPAVTPIETPREPSHPTESEPPKGSYLEWIRTFDIDAPAPLPPETQFATTTIWNLADGHRPNLDFLNPNGSKQ